VAVIREMPFERLGRTLVNQELSFELGDKAQPGFFDGGDGKFAADTRILFEELVQGVATFQVVNQDLEWNTGSAEYGLSSEDISILDDDATHLHVPRH
jgi:hypothetical protein